MKKFSKYLSVIVLFMVITIVQSCDPVIEPPEQAISLEEANVLEDEYITTRWELINESLDIDQDTRDFWFSIETLKQYIAYVEQEGKAQGLENLGIRIYFGAYPMDSNYPDPGYATVVLVPTAEQAENNDVRKGFLPFQQNNEIIEGAQALNYAGGGRPPNNID